MKLTCIMCPLGCLITAEKVGKTYKISGNNCARGEKYAIDEMTNPKRIVTSLIKTKFGVLPCKTNQPVDKKLVFDVLNEINKVRISNAKIGDVVIKNVCNSGADVVVTGNRVKTGF